MRLPRFLGFANYEVIDFQEFLTKGEIHIHLRAEKTRQRLCHRCKHELSDEVRGDHMMRIESLPIMGHRTYIHFRRYKYHCYYCNKARSEAVEFVSDLSPHFTADYAWWLGRFCEIAAVSRVAEFNSLDGMTTWRIDYHRMIAMLANYQIPKARRISVDEVYARRKKKPGENRDDLFVTVISDLETRKVIWVSDSRRKEALDNFFKILGPEACQQIEVVAIDQHDGYKASVEQNCPRATVVWDKFHLLQNFEVAVNESRKDLFEELDKYSPIKKLAMGRYRFNFLKRASYRTKEEQSHIDEVVKHNKEFMKLELIKERMLTFFNEPGVKSARSVFDEIGDWIWQAQFKPLMKWHNQLEAGWETLKNYFEWRVTTSLSEGINNVIKSIKRRGFGFRNMQYFKLKIMQVCGYLNSKFIPTAVQ